MTLTSRPYRTTHDLQRIQRATAHWIERAGFAGYLNVSDIALRLFNGQRKYAPGEIVRLWENSDRQIVGWAMIYPAWNSYEVQVHPDYRQSAEEMDMLSWAERETIHWLRRLNRANPEVQLDIYADDAARIHLLERRGYRRRDHRSLISSRSLAEPLPRPQLPPGFTIRSVQGEHEAEKLVVHINDSFGWKWTAQDYQAVMRSPGCRPENELVVVAPDGCFAASCILLPDEHNHLAMLENVGTGSRYRRLGLAKALLYAAMHRLRDQGFTLVMVPHQAGPLPAAALYRSVGFSPVYEMRRYTL